MIALTATVMPQARELSEIFNLMTICSWQDSMCRPHSQGCHPGSYTGNHYGRQEKIMTSLRATLGAQRESQWCRVDGIHSSSSQDHSWQGRATEREAGQLVFQSGLCLQREHKLTHSHSRPQTERCCKEGSKSTLQGCFPDISKTGSESNQTCLKFNVVSKKCRKKLT